jgi:tetratricopeptide (TPR) repeat protein
MTRIRGGHRQSTPGRRHLAIATVLICTLACQTQSWEQYMEAAAFAYQDQDFVAAEQWFVAAEQIALEFEPSDPRLAITLGNLADFYHAQARDAEAEPLYQEALARLERIDGPESPRVGRFVADLAVFYAVLDQPEEAEPLFQRALDILDWTLGPDHADVLVIRTSLAGLYLQEGRYRDAEPLYREVLAHTLGQTQPDQDQLLTVLQEYAIVFRGMDRPDDALALESRARAIRDAL